MKRSYQTMIFATLCLAAMVSPVAVQAQGDEYEYEDMPVEDNTGDFGPDESWPEVSSTIENWPADDPSGCKRRPLRLASLRRPLTPSLATSLLAQTRSTWSKSILIRKTLLK